ncbi:MAG TPA: efflux RND transporter periplasmic adaptor subunit, partial [Bryobacteraceae bacterium]|nr:efflux RND transporter periplasmic adaptor subunit [Bryobacteraceae bacterium]
MKKRLIPILIVLVAVGGWLAVRATRRNGDGRLLLSGNIELTRVDIAFKTAGMLVERTVDEGDNVRAGQVVARLDREQLERQRQAQVAALAAAEAQLHQARTAARWQKETQAADVAQRRAELGAVQARLQELETGARPQEIQEARAAVAAANTEFERARLDWERAQVLHKNDDISTAQRDQYRARYESAQAALKQARERASLVEAGPRSEVIEAANSQVARARAGVSAGEANALEVRRREQEIPARQAEIERLRAQIALIDAQLADTVAATPVGGVVLVKSADPGEVVAPGTTILSVGDIDHPWLRGYISERDLGRVKIGNEVRVTTDSFPGKVYKGRVSFISSEAEFTPKQIQTQEERVKLVYRV